MRISTVRGWLYFLAKLLGDLSAIQKGRIGQRLVRRAAGRLSGRLLGRLFK